MSAIRSSVRTPRPKMPWGTILKPEFEMGHQKMTGYEIEQTVERLYKVQPVKERVYDRPGPKLPPEEADEIFTRLSTVPEKTLIPDSDRRIMKSMNASMGVVSSYAWKGYN
ncbi:uncharacterized protein [Argopecten irradians]|uniref:uncharacterized protein n=1 Tax=Argopecten irradians TaxID=31199 RepID=UPI003719D2CD